MENHDVLREIISKVLSLRTGVDKNTRELIAAEILAKLIHKTTFQEEDNETNTSQD
jgi:hypothetical protein